MKFTYPSQVCFYLWWQPVNDLSLSLSMSLSFYFHSPVQLKKGSVKQLWWAPRGFFFSVGGGLHSPKSDKKHKFKHPEHCVRSTILETYSSWLSPLYPISGSLYAITCLQISVYAKNSQILLGILLCLLLYSSPPACIVWKQHYWRWRHWWWRF